MSTHHNRDATQWRKNTTEMQCNGDNTMETLHNGDTIQQRRNVTEIHHNGDATQLRRSTTRPVEISLRRPLWDMLFCLIGGLGPLKTELWSYLCELSLLWCVRMILKTKNKTTKSTFVMFSFFIGKQNKSTICGEEVLFVWLCRKV